MDVVQFLLGGLTAWQNLLLAAGSMVFIISLLPTLRERKAALPWTTSLPTAIVLSLYPAIFISWGYGLALVLGVGQAVMWWMILAWRRVK